MKERKSKADYCLEGMYYPKALESKRGTVTRKLLKGDFSDMEVMRD